MPSRCRRRFSRPRIPAAAPRRRRKRSPRQRFEPMARATAPVPGPGILDIAPYVGGESKAAGVERPIRLASNESALGPSPKAIAAYKALAGEIHRYPDGGAAELRAALGRHHGLDPERIVCGSGSDELIGLLQRAYAGPGTEVLYSRHGFLMYSIGALAVGATPVAVPERDLTADVDAILAHVNERTRLVFIANPNNPTGTYLSAEEMARLHAKLPPHVVLAIDAAYAAFAFLQKRGILVRQMGGYGLPECLRITIGTGEEMEGVAAALTEFTAAR